MNCKIDNIEFNITEKKMKQMIFIFNAIENGWVVKKQGERFFFNKKHEGRSEIYNDAFIDTFINKNADLTQFIHKMFE